MVIRSLSYGDTIIPKSKGKERYKDIGTYNPKSIREKKEETGYKSYPRGFPRCIYTIPKRYETMEK